jgi:hypothetical protein
MAHKICQDMTDRDAYCKLAGLIVSPKHLPRYVAKFYYRFNLRFWEPQMFNQMLHAFLNPSIITFPELKA